MRCCKKKFTFAISSPDEFLSFFWRHLRDRELSSPQLVQSASWRIRELCSYRLYACAASFIVIACAYMMYQQQLNSVAEMGDRLATIDMSPKVGAAVSLYVGDLGPHVTQCGLGRGLPSYQVASRSIQPFGHNTPTLQAHRHTQIVVQTDRQRSDSNSIERTVLESVAQKMSTSAVGTAEHSFEFFSTCYYLYVSV